MTWWFDAVFDRFPILGPHHSRRQSLRDEAGRNFEGRNKRKQRGAAYLSEGKTIMTRTWTRTCFLVDSWYLVSLRMPLNSWFKETATPTVTIMTPSVWDFKKSSIKHMLVTFFPSYCSKEKNPSCHITESRPLPHLPKPPRFWDPKGRWSLRW